MAVGGLGSSHGMTVAVIPALQLSSGPLIPACSPILVLPPPLISVTPNMPPHQIPFLLKIVKVCFRHMSVRVLTGNRWLSQTGNWSRL